MSSRLTRAAVLALLLLSSAGASVAQALDATSCRNWDGTPKCGACCEARTLVRLEAPGSDCCPDGSLAESAKLLVPQPPALPAPVAVAALSAPSDPHFRDAAIDHRAFLHREERGPPAVERLRTTILLI